jgi:hypothetical protein
MRIRSLLVAGALAATTVAARALGGIGGRTDTWEWDGQRWRQVAP